MTTLTSAPKDNSRTAIAAILAISAAATLFLFWLIYLHPAADTTGTQYAFLPALNAILNGLSAISLLIGFTFIKSRKIAQHRAAMITAFIFSTLFLVSYILHHALHGDVKYPDKPLRVFYWLLLGSHISLATIALPLVLTTFFFSLSGRIPMHRKIARWTFPIWLYVSITGVITYVMLRLAMG